MKLLLTSAGFTNAAISDALLELTRQPFKKTNLVFVNTASNIEEGDKSFFIGDLINCQKLGFASIDILDFATLSEKFWRPRLEKADILLFGGGNTFHLMNELIKSSLKSLLPEMLKTKVYVGVSAGSIITGPDISVSGWGRDWDKNIIDLPEMTGLGWVPFAISPHFINQDRVILQQKTKEVAYEIYPLTDEQAVMVQDDHYQLVGEGERIILG